jgi:hypothetical protein
MQINMDFGSQANGSADVFSGLQCSQKRTRDDPRQLQRPYPCGQVSTLLVPNVAQRRILDSIMLGPRVVERLTVAYQEQFHCMPHVPAWKLLAAK